MPTVTIEKFRDFAQNCEVLNIFKVDMTFTLNDIDLKMILKALVQYKLTAEYVNYDILFIWSWPSSSDLGIQPWSRYYNDVCVY